MPGRSGGNMGSLDVERLVGDTPSTFRYLFTAPMWRHHGDKSIFLLLSIMLELTFIGLLHII